MMDDCTQSMSIALPERSDWNSNRLTLVEQPSHTGDMVLVCVHKDYYDPGQGTTVKVLKADLIRAAEMLKTDRHSFPPGVKE
jgi:hypothetical protein